MADQTQSTDPQSGETHVMRHLADAMDALQSAAAETGHGLVMDHCVNAQREIRMAMHIAVGVDNDD